MWNLKVNENLDNSDDNINLEFRQGEEIKIIKDEDIKLANEKNYKAHYKFIFNEEYLNLKRIRKSKKLLVLN